jgi:hypothetical protein
MEEPSPFRKIAPDQLQVRKGGGCGALFGLPFFGAGLLVLLLGARVIPVDNADEVPVWGWTLMLLMGLVFAAVGCGLALGRRWFTLDLGRGSVLDQWGLLVPMRQQEHSLHDYGAVVIQFDAGDSDTADRYPVVLRATGDGSDLELSTSTEYGESRRQAAFVAQFLKYPLVDATTGHELVTEPGQHDETLQERLRSGDDEYESIARPFEMRSQVDESSGVVQIVIPSPGLRAPAIIGVIIPVAVLIFVLPDLAGFFRDTETPQFIGLLFLGFIGLFFVLFPLLGVVNSLVLARRGGTVVSASAMGIDIEERGIWRSKVTSISATDILDIDYATVGTVLDSAEQAGAQELTQLRRSGAIPRWLTALGSLVPSKGITVKCTSGLFTFGAGLPDEEVRYLHSIVKRALGGRGIQFRSEW